MKFNKGDRVTITRRATDDEMGIIHWHPEMNKAIGSNGTVGAKAVYDDMYFVKIDHVYTDFKYPTSILELVKEKKMSKRETYIKAQSLVDINIGDVVILKSKAADYQFGWSGEWNHDLNDYIDAEGTVIDTNPESGFEVAFGDAGDDIAFTEWVPFFVIEKIDDPEQIIVPLGTGDYDAFVTADGINVGCQEISFEVFDELAKAVKKIRG